MGKVEKRAAKRIKRTHIQDSLVLALFGAATLALAITAPNAVKLMKYVDPDFARKRKPSYRLRQAATRLVNKGLAAYTETKNGMSLILTGKGEKYAERLKNASRLSIPKPRKWDKRWRIVVFDIWEKRRIARDRLRRMLKKIGFVKVQNSVWVYPYDCEELLMFIRTELKLGRSVLYFVAEGVENDFVLRKYFGLPKE